MAAKLKKTPLHDFHLDLGAKMAEFGGWEMPTQYSGIIEEHKAVRENAGIFDVSHMGEIVITGENAFSFLQKLTTNNLSKIENKQVQYTMMCNPEGGIIDDFLIYRYHDQKYLMVVNAANERKDFEWLKKHKTPGVEISNISNKIGEVALQGPEANQILQELTDFKLNELKFFRFEDNVKIDGVEVLVSRTGYTGEDGFEIYTDSNKIQKVWKQILKTGKSREIQPVGLGARNTLRFEACLPLYGHEIDDTKNPLEANLGYFVDLNKKEFIGQKVLKNINKAGLEKKLTGMEMIERGIPRKGYNILKNGNNIGEITSGSYSPTLDKYLGLGYVNVEYDEIGTEVEIQIRKRTAKARLIETPFYKKNK